MPKTFNGGPWDGKPLRMSDRFNFVSGILKGSYIDGAWGPWIEDVVPIYVEDNSVFEAPKGQ
jgi:hypothetical protein